jgi:hypothetical protein
MTRQRVTGLVIVLAFAGLLLARGVTGHGLGRVYVQAQEVSLKTVDETRADGRVVQVGAPAPAAEATHRWTAWSEVPPKTFFEAQAKDPTQSSIVLSWPRTVGLWLAAFFTLAVFSFLWRDNACYKVAEATVIGVSAGYWMVIGVWDALVPKLFGVLVPGLVRAWAMPSLADVGGMQKASMVVAFLLGVLMLARLLPRGGWVAMWPLAFIVGTFSGMKLVSHVESDLMAQTVASMQPVVEVVSRPDGSVDAMATVWASLAQALVLVGVVCTLTYFLFSVQHRGAVGGVARVGVWYLMITFGAAFGFTVMGRIALLAARFEFLFDDWLWLIDPNHLRG